MNLSRRAETMLAELARDHGLTTLQPNPDGVTPIAFGDVTVALAFSPRRDIACFMSVVEERPDPATNWAERSLALGKQMKGHSTRLAVEAHTGSLVLISTFELAGARLDKFNAALEEFVMDARATSNTLAGGTAQHRTGSAIPISDFEIVFRG